MKDKRIFIVIVFGLLVAAIIIYTTNPGKKPSVPSPAGATPQASITRLEMQVQQLKSLIHTYVQIDRSLRQEYKQEQEEYRKDREKLESLRENLKKVLSENENLSKELARAQAGLEVTQPIRERLKVIDDSLANLWVRPLQEKELSQLLRSIEKELKSIDRSIPNLIKENKSYKGEVQALSGILDKKKQQLEDLEAQAKDDKMKKQALEKNINSLTEQLRAAGSVSSISGKQITELQNIVDTLKQNNSSLSSKNSGLEKELDSLKSELEQINRERQIILKEVENVSAIASQADKLQQELSHMNVEMGQLKKDYMTLKLNYNGSQDALKQTELEMGKRADKILTLQSKLSEAQNKLADIQLRSKDAEKETAVLREQYVSVQMERENLKNDLEQARDKLNNLQSKLQQIGSIFGTSEQSQSSQEAVTEEKAEAAEPAAKKVDVKLLPQIQPETKNEEQTQ